MRPIGMFLALFVICISWFFASTSAFGQAIAVGPRITRDLDESQLTTLRGNIHPLAQSEFNRGPAPPDLAMQRMLLVLKRSAEQDAALRNLLDDQQDKASPSFHHWLTPEEFGLRFGPADQDIETITSWLQTHGFQVAHVAKGHMEIEFSGNAMQVEEAFHTAIHKFTVNGQDHWANSNNPSIPTALTPVVAGIATLHNFPRKPLHRTVGVLSQTRDTGRYRLVRSLSSEEPLVTSGTSCGLLGTSCYSLSPYDFATIYNVLPLWNATPAIDGTGQSIAIVGQSEIYPQDFTDFRSNLGLPPATLNIIKNGPDPGKLASQGDELESDLDVEWSGAVAKGATIDFVTSASTNSSAGVDLSALYIVDNNVAPIMSESYGACELDMGTAGNLFFNHLWQQAAAEGITVFIAAGDSGSAVCDADSSIAKGGLSVSGVSSTPYDIAVGGTDFDNSQNPSIYWNSTNDPVTHSSAKSYIPETTWNDSCTNSEFFQFTGDKDAESDCNNSSSKFWPNFLVPVAGSGGASNCTISSNQSTSSCSGGYAKPSWQTGTGVPNDGKRDVPDVSLFAANGLNASFYLVCETDVYGGCEGADPGFVGIGGTSASAPALAGIMALVNQKTQSRQGNANYVFYPLAAQPGASCNSSATVGSPCIFYDVTSGTIAMPCLSGSPNCVTKVAGDKNGVLSGYSTTAGYDLATGLGSVNVANLVNNWSAVSFQPTAAALSLNPTQITHGTPVNLNLTVAAKTGMGTPTGNVSLQASTGQNAGTFTLSNGAVSKTTTLLPGGSYTVTAHYAGDGTYAATDSSPGIPVTVNPEASSSILQVFTLDQKGNATPFTAGPYGGNVVYLRTNVAGQSGQGVATGTVNLSETLNGININVSGNPYPLNSTGDTMTPLPLAEYPFFSPGTYSFAASYSGDASFNPSTSPIEGFTITKAQTSISTYISGVWIFATVISNASLFSSLPTGTMAFYSNGTQLGSPVALDSGIVVSFPLQQLPPGEDSITMQYSGDANYMGSSGSAGLIVEPGGFTITANPTAINISRPGQSGSTSLTFAAQQGFTGSATLSSSMCSNLPPESSCSFNPSTVTLNSSTPNASVTLSITTTGPHALVSSTYRLRPESRMAACEAAGLCMVAVCIGLVGPCGKSRRRSAFVALIVVMMIASAISCGGGSGGNTGSGGITDPGTPTGKYTLNVRVTINGVVESIHNLSVAVQ